MAGNLESPTLEPPPATPPRPAAPPEPAAPAAREEKDGKSAGLHLVRPAEVAGWEMGRIKRNGGVFPVQAPSDGPRAEEKNPANKNVGIVAALPTRQVLGLPLWLATDDGSLFPEMVALQLEKRGLAQGILPTHRLQIRVVVRETGRTLVLALVLAEPCAEDILATGARAFEPMPLTFPIPENALVFWKEQGQVVMAYRRNAQLAYLHAFTHSEVTDSLTGELTCVLLPLMQDQVLVDLKKVLAWGAFTSQEISLLGQTLEFPVQAGARPGLMLPAETSPLIPDTVVHRRETKRRNERMKKIGLLLAACYLVFLSFVVGQFLMLKVQVSQAETKLKADAPTVKRLQTARDTWLAVEGSIDPAFYSSEVLLHTALALPPEGVRLKSFNMDQTAVTLQGEAKNVHSAQLYFQEVQKRDALMAYDWGQGPPKMLADGKASFTITGKSLRNAGNDQ